MLTNVLLAALVGAALLLLYAAWKIYLRTTRIEGAVSQNQRQVRTLFNQLQAYHELTGLLQLEAPLPPLRGWAASPDFLLHIASHALSHRPTTILECSSGVSSVILARCCQLNGRGHVYSLEHEPQFAALTREAVATHGLEAWATVLDAPLMPRDEVNGQPWYSTQPLEQAVHSVDMLVIDGPPGTTAPLARYPALPVLMPRLSASCALFLDDADRPDEKETTDRWLHEFPEFELRELTAEKGCVRLLRQGADELPHVRNAS